MDPLFYNRMLCCNLNYKALAFFILIVSFTIPSFAQFYDKDDEVRYYLWKDDKYPSNSMVLAFNFNGDKGAVMGTTNSPGIDGNRGFSKERLLEDSDLFIKSIYDQSRISIIKYSNEKSTSLNAVYVKSYPINNMFGFIDHYTYIFYKFSKSGDSLQLSGDATSSSVCGKVFLRVTLHELLEYLSEAAAKIEKSKRWR